MVSTLRNTEFRILSPKNPKLQTDDERRTTNDQRPTTNDERPTTNEQRRTTNDERRTTNDERRTTNDERRMTNDERRTTNDERRTTTTNDVAALFVAACWLLVVPCTCCGESNTLLSIHVWHGKEDSCCGRGLCRRNSFGDAMSESRK